MAGFPIPDTPEELFPMENAVVRRPGRTAAGFFAAGLETGGAAERLESGSFPAKGLHTIEILFFVPTAFSGLRFLVFLLPELSKGGLFGRGSAISPVRFPVCRTCSS